MVISNIESWEVHTRVFFKDLVQLPNDQKKIITFENVSEGVFCQSLSIKYLFFLVIQSKFHENLQINLFL